jgi:hypothetical protein
MLRAPILKQDGSEQETSRRSAASRPQARHVQTMSRLRTVVSDVRAQDMGKVLISLDFAERLLSLQSHDCVTACGSSRLVRQTVQKGLRSHKNVVSSLAFALCLQHQAHCSGAKGATKGSHALRV